MAMSGKEAELSTVTSREQVSIKIKSSVDDLPVTRKGRSASSANRNRATTSNENRLAGIKGVKQQQQQEQQAMEQGSSLAQKLGLSQAIIDKQVEALRKRYKHLSTKKQRREQEARTLALEMKSIQKAISQLQSSGSKALTAVRVESGNGGGEASKPGQSESEFALGGEVKAPEVNYDLYKTDWMLFPVDEFHEPTAYRRKRRSITAYERNEVVASEFHI